jgi:hypothetical protein
MQTVGYSSRTDVEKLLSDYLDLINRSLVENADLFWYRQAKRLNRMVWADANFRTIIYDGDPSNVVGEFTIHFDTDANELSILPPGDHRVAFAWKASLDYLRDVAESRPDWYLEHPMMLDWKWITERVRDEVSSRAGSRAARNAVIGSLALGAAVGAASAYAYRSRRRSRLRWRR